MSVPAQAGILSFGMQADKTTEATVYYQHKAADINFGAVQDQRTFPPEVGDDITPTGAYKAGAFAAGGATIQPRLQGDFGWLFKALMGNVTSTPGTPAATAVRSTNINLAATGTNTTGITSPPSARRLLFTVTGLSGTATVRITGTRKDGTTTPEDVLINGAAIVSTHAWATVTGFEVTSAASAGTATVGYYQSISHAFTFAADKYSIPWMSVRKYIPGPSPLGEKGVGCKLASLRMMVPQNGIIQARADWVGRIPSLEEGPSWTYAGDFEDYESVPVSCAEAGGVLFPVSGGELAIQNLVIQFVNNMTSPQQEMVIGSHHPDDFVALSRAMTIQATLKWENPDLYQRILTNNASGTAWSPVPYTSDFRAKVVSPGDIPGATGTPYSLQIDAAKVMWAVNGAPALAGGDILLLPVIGTVLRPATGSQYATFTVVNEQYAY